MVGFQDGTEHSQYYTEIHGRGWANPLLGFNEFLGGFLTIKLNAHFYVAKAVTLLIPVVWSGCLLGSEFCVIPTKYYWRGVGGAMHIC